ncbi:MAG: segregation/condensation protein A [Candidatus Omnitrophica bacterium]|jgi:segregation and condensation protein A|nr:segregation/condensation protein A [Candidatus Omnitrophota bacterium]MDD5079474.1 segregation/condensation protein A [Candidatus Omnitrophota bacterium]
MNYKIKLELFEGPLDLLLYLVKRDHLNIYDIPIAKVTEQYLSYLELMKCLDLNIAGEFLVMAATLMQIKSKMLLPAVESEEAQDDAVDPRDELVKQLLEYERFKEIAQELRQREIKQQDIFKRPKLQEKDLPETAPVYFEASIFDLITAFSQALEETPKDIFYNVIKDEYSIEDKIHQILHLLLLKNSVKLSELFTQAKTKIEIIVTFLSILELVKLREIRALQCEAFGEIEIARNQNNIIPYDQRTESQSN